MPRANAPAVVPEVPILIATTSGVLKVKGTVYRYYRGITKLRPDHPLVRAIPDRFEPIRLDYEKG